MDLLFLVGTTYQILHSNESPFQMYVMATQEKEGHDSQERLETMQVGA